VLLAKTLTSQTFRLALISISIFGAILFALLSYVYRSTASYLHGRSDLAIAAELTSLLKAHDGAGRNGLIAQIPQRIAEQRLEGGVYLFAGPTFAPLAGNLTEWPAAMTAATGWGNF
jgi:hypothetical protein